MRVEMLIINKAFAAITEATQASSLPVNASSFSKIIKFSVTNIGEKITRNRMRSE